MDVNSLHDPDFIRSSGVASRLSAQMGVSEDEAITGLQQAMGLMAEQAGSPQPAPRKASARKTRAKKTNAGASETATKPRKKKASKKDSGPDFMDLLDEPK